MHQRVVLFDSYGRLLLYVVITAAWSARLEALYHWLANQGLRIVPRDLDAARAPAAAD